MNIEEAIDKAVNRRYREMILIYDGSREYNNNPRSHVYRVGPFCVKYYLKSKLDFKCEVDNLNKLKPYGFAPQLYYSDKNENFIIMEYINGKAIGDIANLSSEQRNQLNKIHSILKKEGIYYEKDEIHCIVEENGNLRFIDFNI